MLPKNHRTTFDRLLSLVKEDDNRAELRSHMEDIRLPCIPFLGKLSGLYIVSGLN